MKNKTNTYLSIASVLAFIAICAYAYLYSFVSGLTDRTSALKSEVQVQEIKVRSAQSLSRSAENTSMERKTLAGFFIQPNKAVDFITMVERSAAALSLTYSTTQIDSLDMDALTSQNKELLKMSMTISGSWRNVLRFLEYIETLPYAVDVQRIELSVDQSGLSPVSASSTALRSGNWKLGITFVVVKIKDNAR